MPNHLNQQLYHPRLPVVAVIAAVVALAWTLFLTSNSFAQATPGQPPAGQTGKINPPKTPANKVNPPGNGAGKAAPAGSTKAPPAPTAAGKAAPAAPSQPGSQKGAAPNSAAPKDVPPNDTSKIDAANSDANKSASSNAPGPGGAAPAAGAATAATPVPPPPDLSIPPNASREALLKVIASAKGFRPHDLDQYRLQQTALRDASNALVKLIENKEDPVRQQAELDSLSSNAALMTNESDEAREKVLEKITTYLKSRKQLSLADVQTGMIVGFYLELQPRKSPARDVYATMVELLTDDEREEMQALRFNLQSNVRRLEMLGNKLELDAPSLDGKPIKTEDFAGKFVLVDFFATWCQPCIDEVPRLKRHWERHHEKGLEIVAISLDDDREVLDKYLAEAKLPWPVIHDSAPELKDKLQSKYGISSLPTVLLLNKEGAVVSLEARGAELDRLMDRLFEMPTPAEPETAQAPGSATTPVGASDGEAAAASATPPAPGTPPASATPPAPNAKK